MLAKNVELVFPIVLYGAEMRYIEIQIYGIELLCGRIELIISWERLVGAEPE